MNLSYKVPARHRNPAILAKIDKTALVEQVLQEAPKEAGQSRAGVLLARF